MGKNKLRLKNGLVQDSLRLSFGASIVGSIPANSVQANGLQGLTNASSFLPAQGTVLGGIAVLKAAKGLEKAARQFAR